MLGLGILVLVPTACVNVGTRVTGARTGMRSFSDQVTSVCTDGIVCAFAGCFQVVMTIGPRDDIGDREKWSYRLTEIGSDRWR